MVATSQNGRITLIILRFLKGNIFLYWLAGPKKWAALRTINLFPTFLDFIDYKVQVRTNDLSPNLFYYLPTLYHCSVNHPKKAHASEGPKHIDLHYAPKLLISEEKERLDSDYFSDDLELNSADEGI